MSTKRLQRKQQTDKPVGTVRNWARQGWLAALGAAVKVQEGGVELFQNLVEEGEAKQAKGRKAVEDQFDQVVSRIDEAKSRGSETWDKLEKVFQQRVERALNRLNVPTAEDVRELGERVEKLNAELREVGVPARKSAAATSRPNAKKVEKAPEAAQEQAEDVRSAA